MSASREERAEELRKAIRRGDKDKVVRLLKNTARPGEIRYYGNSTLLHYAAQYGMTDVCQLLVEQYQVDTEEKSSDERTALHWACINNHTDTVKYLVTHAHCDPLIKDPWRDTPLSDSRIETKQFLEDIIDQSTKEGFTNVPDYTRAKERQYILDEAMAEGGGDLHQCNIVFHGPPGAGKSSVKALMLGKPPCPKHKQTATDIVEKCVRTVSIDRVAATSDQQGFEIVDNDDIITRIMADIEKYRKQKKSHKINPHNSPTAADSTVTSLITLPEETTSDNAESDGSIMSVLENPSGDHPPSTQCTKTVESIRAGLLRFSSSYKPVFDSRWLHHIDSGGQPQYLDTFPLMYRTPNSHFVNVMRLTDGLDERPKVRFYIKGNDEYCLPDHLVLTNREVIIQMCQVARRISRATEGKFTPRVFVVGTHEDKLGFFSKSKRLRELNEQLAPIYKDYNDVLIPKSDDEFVFHFNAMATGKERKQCTEELQRHILLATKDAGNPTTVPLKWLVYHLELEKCADVVRMEKCQELAEAVGIPKERVRAALEFLNKAALVLYYPDDVPDLVITKMDPFTSRLSKLIKASFIAPDTGPIKESNELREKGVFKMSFLQRVFHDVADNLISDEEFLKLLESLKIAVHIGGDEYFLPSALSLKPPSGRSSFDSNSTPLALLWDELILPHGFFLTVSVELQDKTRGEEGYVFELRRDKPQWRGAIQLSEKRNQIPGVVKLIDQQCWIQVSYSGDSSYCPIVYRSVNTAVQRAIKRLKHTGIDSPTVACVCPLCEENNHPSSISADNRFVTCSRNNDNIGPVTPNISCWFEGGTLSDNSKAIEQAKENAASVPPLIEVDGIDDLKVDVLEVFNSLKSKAHDWNAIGRQLKVPHGYRESVLKQGVQTEDEDKLENVLYKWEQSICSPVKWSTVLDVMRELEYNEILEHTVEYLKNKDN